MFAEQLGLFVDRAITVALAPYKHLHAHMEDMEARVNDRLKDLTVPELVRFAVELKKAQNDILKLQQEWQPQEFSLVDFEESEDDAPFIDLLGEQPKEKAELKEAPKQSRVEEEMRAKVGGTSSSSAPPVERHVTGATIHSESTTLATLPPAIEATEATNSSFGITPPQTVAPESGV
ncbi:hypothetical protein HAX54_010478 [Datura stramonium]|uniref:Uncharacterized protein n=1 Tax=Datura stramonium TaxID=4076 RepID=A0ABS8RWT6_DATST|nr:hypothetical protein [Datura stramonium]